MRSNKLRFAGEATGCLGAQYSNSKAIFGVRRLTRKNNYRDTFQTASGKQVIASLALQPTGHSSLPTTIATISFAN
jgi:hypothetical protein